MYQFSAHSVELDKESSISDRSTNKLNGIQYERELGKTYNWIVDITYSHPLNLERTTKMWLQVNLCSQLIKPTSSCTELCTAGPAPSNGTPHRAYAIVQFLLQSFWRRNSTKQDYLKEYFFNGMATLHAQETIHAPEKRHADWVEMEANRATG